jgi:UDP-glucose 4-epimerase
MGGRMRVLVTGGAGFIGSHLVDVVLARGDQVHVVDNLATGSRENLASGATLHELDIRDEALGQVVAQVRPEVVFHLAAQADVGTSVELPVFDADVNVIGTVRVLEAARAVGARVIFTSSGGAIYGECENPACEDDELQPLSPYGTSKLAGEEYLTTWNRLYGTSHVACRFANVYGPRQLPILEGGVIAIFLDRLRDRQETVIFGDGKQTRDFVYVGDVVAGLLAAAESIQGGVYNIGTGIAVDIREVHRLCAEVVGADQEPRFGPARPGDLQHSVIDPSRAVRELDWRAEKTLAEGLADTWRALS